MSDQRDPAASLMLEAIRSLGLRYRPHAEDLGKWKAECPVCRAWTLLVFEHGDHAAATCQNECDRVEILRALADVLAQNEAARDLPRKRHAFLARLGVATEPPDDEMPWGERALSVSLSHDAVTALESARERIELEQDDPLRLEDVLVAAAQEGLRSWQDTR